MPEPRPKTIGFYTKGPPFDGSTLAERSLGGSETALIQAARALAERGHEVMVFNDCPHPGRHEGVTYRPWPEFAATAAGVVFDIFLVSRTFDFFVLPFQARLKVLWNHDTLDRPARLRAVLDRIDLIFTLSAFHRDNFLARIPELEGKTFVTRNGVDLALIDRAAAGVVKDPDKVIYASRPERGLKVLLESIWPVLVERRPGLTLYLCGYEVKAEDLTEGLPELYTELERLAAGAPNLVRLGPLAKEDYYGHLAQAALMLYPCTFPEISCLATLEAQACRTPILTTDGFALAETVQVPEFKVSGRPGSPEYNQAFVQQALGLLEAPARAAGYAARARTAVEIEYTWPAIVAEWDRLFDLYLASRQAAGGLRP